MLETITVQRKLDGGPNPPVLGEILRLQALANPDRLALLFEDQSISYATFAQRARKVANALIELGVEPGTRIGYIGRNSADWFELLFGTSLAGAVFVPMNWRLSVPELAYIIADSEARILFVEADFAELVAEAVGQDGTAPYVLGLGEPFRIWRDKSPDADPAISVSPDDIALQIYTSGTTGRPKGAMLSHHALNTVRVSQPEESAWSRWKSEDRCLVSMPLFHIGGVSMAFSALYHGAGVVIAREFTPDRLFDLIEQHRITRLFLVPAAIRMALDHPRARTADISSLVGISYGASPITPALLREAIATFGCGFVQVYGLTETSGTVVALPPEDHDPDNPRRLAATGKAMAGVELAILDVAGEHLRPGEMGEIAIRSQAVMAGYWRKPEATRSAITEDGWLRTGDVGFLDEDGYLYLRDRVNDMIISGGENVYPVEVEDVLADHPHIADVAIIGVPHPRWGEAVKALIVPRPGVRFDAEEALQWARQRLAGYKVPKSIEMRSDLPRNAAGKILRREMRAPYWPVEQKETS